PLAGESHKSGEALGLVGGQAAPLARQPITAAANAVGFALLNHASAKKSFDDAVERAGAELHFAGRQAVDVLHDAVAMARPSQQGEQDVKLDVCRWHVTMTDIATSDIVTKRG